jgi:hypothetical protein
MESRRLRGAGVVLLVVGVAVLLSAVLGRAQSVVPVRFDEPSEAAVVTVPSWAVMAGLLFEPQDKPPVRCNAANVGFFYIQRDAQGATPSPQINTAPCYCTSCVDATFCDGGTGYADPAFYWSNTAGQLCANLWIPEPT